MLKCCGLHRMIVFIVFLKREYSERDMKKLKIIFVTACLPLLGHTTEVARFDAKLQVATNSPNQTLPFTFDSAAPVVSQRTTSGYSGPDIYGAMDMKAGAYWRVAQANESGMSVRMNRSAGNWVNGLFLLPAESIRFVKDNDMMHASDIFTSQIHRMDSATIRFVIRAGGKFYISEPSSNFCRGGEGHQTDSFMIFALDAEWFNYDPVTSIDNGSVIGSSASPRFSDIDFVGFALFAKGSEAGEGVNFGVRSFSVTAKK